MSYYIVVTFQVTIDRIINHIGTTGFISDAHDFNRGAMIADIKKVFHKEFPKCKSLTVFIVEAAIMSAEEYLKASITFTSLSHPPQ